MNALDVLPVIVEQTRAELAACRRWQEQIYATGITDSDNYTGIAAEDRFFNGYRGELATGTWLTRNRVRYSYRVTIDGRSQHRSDFAVGRAQLEVKTAAEPYHRRFMMPEAQKIRGDYFVGGRCIDAERVELWGWLRRAEVAALPIGEFGHGPTRWHWRAELEPLHELLAILREQ